MSEKLTVKNVVNINKSTLSSKENWSTLNYLDTGNITENQIDTLQIFQKGEKLPSRAKRKVEKGTIIYSTVRPNQKHFGYFDTYSDDLVVSTGFATLDIIDPRVNSKYLYYLLTQNSVISQLQSIGENSTSSYPSIRPEDIGNLSFMFPDIDIQNKIADILTSIDKKIQINNQINQELEAMAKTLYEYWFVQFDFPDQNGKPYKSSGGKMVYNPELKREIPEGWGVTTFSSWISDNKTGDWGKETSQGNYTLEVDCIRGADINGLSGNGKTDMPTRFILEKNKNKLLTDFDIVIEISGGSPTQSTGRIVGISENVLNRFDLPLICSNFCKAVSLKEQETFYNFVYEWKNLYDNGVLFSWEGKTSGIKNLLFDSFVTNYHIAQPPIDLMEQFFDYASSVDRKIQLLLKQNQELTQLRDWLLPMLMNGQVKVE
ncbi:EcoKI restriction-modification system protein HsdS [Streptococcus oralis]|uniref:EcoKI restriction-modification system protein HsdS n=1 Tax=Streptococcus oralis TaxID=1303 RepID=A0A428BVL1_STROR|nr:restriction endonuclease subunit S [Streptococcus oralis]RSI69723.1 EcoKI restriction-modification system protein HsdS [Streptococcus oralis]